MFPFCSNGAPRNAQTFDFLTQKVGVVILLENLAGVLRNNVTEQALGVHVEDTRQGLGDAGKMSDLFLPFPEHHFALYSVLDRARRGQRDAAREDDRASVGSRVT